MTSINDLGKPKGEKNKIAIAVSGDDTKAKEVVFKLVEELDFDLYDLGSIENKNKTNGNNSSLFCEVGKTGLFSMTPGGMEAKEKSSLFHKAFYLEQLGEKLFSTL